MSNLIKLIRANASIEEIKADLYANRDNKDYVNMVDEHDINALMWACRYNRIEVFKLLLAEDADMTLLNKYDESALKISRQPGYNEIVWLLLEDSINIPMAREEIILQSAQSKTMFNKHIMRQITNLANNRAIKDNLFFTKRDELLDVEIQLTEEEKEILK